MRRVFLIAGHNGAGTGAKKYLDEGAETIILRDDIVDWLSINYPDLKVITDRNRDNLTLAGGLLIWLKSIFQKDDICLDLHFNASNGTATGTEVLIPDNCSALELEGATDLSFLISNTLNLKNRGVKAESQGQHGKLAMLSGFDCENFLAEICFVDNQKDATNYRQYFYQLSEAIGYWLIKTANR
ncbi:MAG: N-acetylmuramoyl-L-alanine amidase [Prevotellaceae bacterium]|jgi:N-acetylmuramoyl-L-alanine amidase|nr:N-acetylmuramoyl-L-alanine amidase [Prevotellaceae bacterium]